MNLKRKHYKKKVAESLKKKSEWSLIFEYEFEAVRDIFLAKITDHGNLPKDSPLNYEHFDI